MLVVSAHAADFVWRAGGAIALAAARGESVRVVCLSFGERGESASAWRAGKSLEEIKALRRGEAENAAAVLGAGIEFLDAGDYPLRESGELIDRIVGVYREVSPSVVLTHPLADPYNYDHPAAGQMALRARVAREDQARKALAGGQLGLDLYGLRDKLAARGVQYLDAGSEERPDEPG